MVPNRTAGVVLRNSSDDVRPQGVPDPETLAPHLRRRYDRIVQAALELLDEAEYEDIPIKAVSDRAGLAQGTLYRYFSSKEHVYAAAMLEWSAEFRARVAAQYEPAFDAEGIRALLLRIVQAYTHHPQVLRVHIILDLSSDPNAKELLKQCLAITDGVMRSACRDLPPDIAPAVGATLLAVLGVAMRNWALGRMSVAEVRKAVNDAVDLILLGVGEPK